MTTTDGRTPAHLDPVVIDGGTRTLAELDELSTSLVYAALLTDDGFDIVHRAGTTRDGGRFASMSSSIQALADAVARELKIGSSEYVIIASALGHIIQLRVPGRQIVLAALFDTHETLGKALSVTRRAAQRMAEIATASESAPAVPELVPPPAPPAPPQMARALFPH